MARHRRLVLKPVWLWFLPIIGLFILTRVELRPYLSRFYTLPEWESLKDNVLHLLTDMLFALGLYGQHPLRPPETYALQAIAPATSVHSSSVCLWRTWGRFGNHIYMIMTSTFYALHHRLKLFLPPCPAQNILPELNSFVQPCPWWSTSRLEMAFDALDPFPFWEEDPHQLSHGHKPSFHVALYGWLQVHTALFAPYQQEIKAIMRLGEPLETLSLSLYRSMIAPHCADSLLITIHIRRGDLRSYKPKLCVAMRIPLSWYTGWLTDLKESESSASILLRLKKLQNKMCLSSNADVDENAQQWLESGRKFTIILLSDDAHQVAAELSTFNYSVITVQDKLEKNAELRTTFSSLPSIMQQYYFDWWIMTQAQVLATSHSTFSLTAAVHNRFSSDPLNTTALFVRPDPVMSSLRAFDPWNFLYNYSACFS